MVESQIAGIRELLKNRPDIAHMVETDQRIDDVDLDRLGLSRWQRRVFREVVEPPYPVEKREHEITDRPQSALERVPRRTLDSVPHHVRDAWRSLRSEYSMPAQVRALKDSLTSHIEILRELDAGESVEESRLDALGLSPFQKQVFCEKIVPPDTDILRTANSRRLNLKKMLLHELDALREMTKRCIAEVENQI